MDKILKSDHFNVRSLCVMQQEELGTTIVYPANIHDMEHDKLGATVIEKLHPMYNISCVRLITACMLVHQLGKGVILNTQIEIENLFKALVLPEINYPLPVFGASMTDLNSIQCLLRQCFKRHFILEPVDNTVNSLVSDNPWGTTKWLLTLVPYGKDQQNKPNTSLIDLLHKNITLEAKIRQIETN